MNHMFVVYDCKFVSKDVLKTNMANIVRRVNKVNVWNS